MLSVCLLLVGFCCCFFNVKLEFPGFHLLSYGFLFFQYASLTKDLLTYFCSSRLLFAHDANILLSLLFSQLSNSRSLRISLYDRCSHTIITFVTSSLSVRFLSWLYQHTRCILPVLGKEEGCPPANLLGMLLLMQPRGLPFTFAAKMHYLLIASFFVHKDLHILS